MDEVYLGSCHHWFHELYIYLTFFYRCYRREENSSRKNEVDEEFPQDFYS